MVFPTSWHTLPPLGVGTLM